MVLAAATARSIRATAAGALPAAARGSQLPTALAMAAATRLKSGPSSAAAVLVVGGCRELAWPARCRRRRCSTARGAWPEDEGQATWLSVCCYDDDARLATMSQHLCRPFRRRAPLASGALTRAARCARAPLLSRAARRAQRSASHAAQ